MKYMLASNIERARERINDAVDSWLIPSWFRDWRLRYDLSSSSLRNANHVFLSIMPSSVWVVNFLLWECCNRPTHNHHRYQLQPRIEHLIWQRTGGLVPAVSWIELSEVPVNQC
jgi:hypothetical protein